jgi:hypothetical protein
VAWDVDDLEVADRGVMWVITDAHGLLLEASREAAAMLNLSMSGLRSRQLLVFFDGERESWRQALRAAASGLTVDREGAVRPREKRPRRISVEISKTQDWRGQSAVLWTFLDPAVNRGDDEVTPLGASSSI